LLLLLLLLLVERPRLPLLRHRRLPLEQVE